MYSPKYALETDRSVIDPVIRENPFATIVFQRNGNVESFHLPLVLKKNKLIGHMAKANEAWKTLDGNPVLVIFHGPQCYISPEWYGTPGNVSTWNYISIQIRGNVVISQDKEVIKSALIDLGKHVEPDFNIQHNISQHSNLLDGIVGVEIHISNILAKFKLAQSKSEDERMNVIHHLENSPKTQEQLVAKAMRSTIKNAVSISRLKDIPEHHKIAQQVLAASPNYFLKISGEKAGPQAGQETFTACPLNFDKDNKHVLALMQGKECIGIADVLFGYLSSEVGFIGLLLISEDYQGKGLGRPCFEELEQYFKANSQIRQIRLAVVATNDVVGFWEKMGFKLTGERKPYSNKKVISESVILEKRL